MAADCSRRTFLSALSAGAAGLAMCSHGLSADDRIEPEPFVYKTLGELQLKADVCRPDDEQPRPVLLWIHGGGLIRGYRADVNRQLKSRLLTPATRSFRSTIAWPRETRLPASSTICRDAYAWLTRKGPELLHADTSRIAVAGDSAGGYLTLMSGVASSRGRRCWSPCGVMATSPPIGTRSPASFIAATIRWFRPTKPGRG